MDTFFADIKATSATPSASSLFFLDSIKSDKTKSKSDKADAGLKRKKVPATPSVRMRISIKILISFLCVHVSLESSWSNRSANVRTSDIILGCDATSPLKLPLYRAQYLLSSPSTLLTSTRHGAVGELRSDTERRLGMSTTPKPTPFSARYCVHHGPNFSPRCATIVTYHHRSHRPVFTSRLLLIGHSLNCIFVLVLRSDAKSRNGFPSVRKTRLPSRLA